MNFCTYLTYHTCSGDFVLVVKFRSLVGIRAFLYGFVIVPRSIFLICNKLEQQCHVSWILFNLGVVCLFLFRFKFYRFSSYILFLFDSVFIFLVTV